MANSSNVIDVNEGSFEQDVIQRSANTLVVVDFWAPWCGPCRMLSPVLEKLEAEDGGRFELVKINTDDNQRLAMQHGIQGIPAVKLYAGGTRSHADIVELLRRNPDADLEQIRETCRRYRLKGLDRLLDELD